MSEASLAFPAVCLTLSFLFVVAVHNASTMQQLGAFHHHTLLPVYQQIQRLLTNHNPINRNLPNRMPEPGYEPISLNTNDEEEQHPPPIASSSMPVPGYYQYSESPALDRVNESPERDSTTETDDLHMTARYAGGPYRPRNRPTFADVAELSTYSPPPSPHGTGVSSDEYDSDWSNSAVDEAVFEPCNPVDDIPIWEFEVERPIYVLDQRNQRGPSAWLDEVVEWTAQGVFAVVAPEMVQQRG
ncbi:hypothetical protein N7491_000524 [Penicillium cf. griseofulvum]|uniref:Uncharacterized protein n=1 Tax=Penicillium cf. griseofulvum TaxID=2972120 RepID=A0A9W9MEI5_9EURO|nr:hypothetical protein N7472_004113 [Penicillium cf. griseofulvum]KAJ5443204.1 hypothetical protein N7445_004317 [Penicillium cf. griseofulvum]KAJ5451342.1 hypothetical protein N7491_000524 [Penicillium cf. griseofulvum]